MPESLKELLQDAALCLGATFLCAVATEIVLRETGLYETYSETQGHGYLSPYLLPTPAPWLWVRPSNTTLRDRSGEFDFELNINADGIRGGSFVTEKSPETYRVVLLGDSYAEGIGANFADTPVALLQSTFNTQDCHGKKVEFLPGGVAGSDPIFSYQLLTRRLLKYAPDLVIMLVNRTDIADIIARGGRDRFDGNGGFRPRPDRPSLVEKIYRRSHLARAVLRSLLGYDQLLVSPAQQEKRTAEAFGELEHQLADFQVLADDQHFQFAVVLHPIPQQIQTPISDDLVKLEGSPVLKNIRVENLEADFRKTITSENILQFAWPVNKHYRAAGYAIFAEALSGILRRTPGFPRCELSPTIAGADLEAESAQR